MILECAGSSTDQAGHNVKLRAEDSVISGQGSIVFPSNSTIQANRKSIEALLFLRDPLRHYALQGVLSLEPYPRRNVHHGKIEQNKRDEDT